ARGCPVSAADGATLPAPATRAPPIWRNRDFLLIWSGQTVSVLGTSIVELSLPLLVLAITDSPAQAGFIASASLIPNLVFSLHSGALVDRWDRRRVMILCDLVRFAAVGSVPVAYALGMLGLAQLYIVAAISGTAAVLFGIAQFSALPRVVRPEDLARAGALDEAASSAAQLVGPGVAGTLIGLARSTVAGAAVAFAVDSLSYLVSAISLLWVRVEFQAERSEPAEPTDVRSEIVAGFRYLWSQPQLRRMALLTMTIVIVNGPVYLAVIVLARELSASAQAIGLLFSLGGLGGILGALVAPAAVARLRIGTIFLLATGIPVLAIPLMAGATHPWMIIAGWAIVESTIPAYNVAQATYRMSLVPDAYQGRVSSIFRLVIFGGMLIGTSVGGVLLGLVGPRIVLCGTCLGMLVTAIGVVVSGLRRA
ncbi:MAG: MFS transporter, partial [Myxococcota bacterium]